MKRLYRMEEWYDQYSDTYHCNDVYVKGGGVWWLVPRMLQMNPAEYIKMLVEVYHADLVYFKDKSVLLMSWKNQSEMRKFKNWVNKKAREAQFYVEAYC